MTPYERDVAERLRAEAAGIAVPARESWVPQAKRTTAWGLRSVAVLGAVLVVLVAALGLGQLLSGYRTSAPSTPNPGLTPLATTITPAQAIAAVRGQSDMVGRIDRVDARLMTLGEYLGIAGPIHTHAGDPQATPDVSGELFGFGDSAKVFWIVAVSGEVWPNYRVPVYYGGLPPVSPTPYPPYRWGMFLVDGATGAFTAVADAGISESSPPAFDRLPNHPATTARLGPSPALLPSPTLAPAATPATGPELRWSQPAMIPQSGRVEQVVKWRDLYVGAADAVDSSQHVAVIFVSRDGFHWQLSATLVAPPQVFAGAPVLVPTATRLFAYVHRSSQLTATDAWESTNGLTWSHIDAVGLSRASVGRVVVQGDVFLALGADTTGATRLWRSVNNVGWGVIALPLPKAIILQIVAVKDGFLAIGRDGDPDVSSGGVGVRGTGVPAAWWSPDALSWTALHVEGVSAPGAQLTDVFAVASGYLAVGSDSATSQRAAVLWSSSDGHDWKLLGAPAHWGLASSDGQQLVVFGYADAQADLLGAWDSSDGRAWTQPMMTGDRADIPGFIGPPSRVDGIYAMPDGVVVIGQQNGQITGWFAAKE